MSDLELEQNISDFKSELFQILNVKDLWFEMVTIWTIWFESASLIHENEVHFLNLDDYCDFHVLNSARVTHWRNQGLRVFIWTVNDPVAKKYCNDFLRVPYLTDTLEIWSTWSFFSLHAISHAATRFFAV
jgi:hypothetical protein